MSLNKHCSFNKNVELLVLGLTSDTTVNLASIWGNQTSHRHEFCTGGYSYPFKCLDAIQFSSVAQLCPTLCDPMDCSTPGLSVHHQLPELAQTQVHRFGDAIQPSPPLSSPSPPAFNLHTEYIMRNARLDKSQAGIKIGGGNINNLRYVDDATLMAESEEELNSLLMKVKEG